MGVKNQWLHSPIANGYDFNSVTFIPFKIKTVQKDIIQWEVFLPPLSPVTQFPTPEAVNLLYTLPDLFYTWTSKLHIHDICVYTLCIHVSIHMQVCVYEYSYLVLFYTNNNNYLHCSVHLFSNSVLLKSDLAISTYTQIYLYIMYKEL